VITGPNVVSSFQFIGGFTATIMGLIVLLKKLLTFGTNVDNDALHDYFTFNRSSLMGDDFYEKEFSKFSDPSL